MTAIREPLTRVVPETPFDQSFVGRLKGYLQIANERKEALIAPGKGLGLDTLRSEKSTNKITDIRARNPREIAIPVMGITKTASGYQVQDVPNPDSPDGSWEPWKYAPNFYFNALEDSFPVLPGFDGDKSVSTDPKNYAHGMVGGSQNVQMDVAVQKKGEYYVLQYASYYADNKVGGDYHDGDWSTVSVYLKPGQDGKLQPAYLYTSWHYGGIMTPWADVPKDAQGHPNVLIGRGSHSVIPMNGCLKPGNDGGLVATGDGRLVKRGSSRVLPNQLTFNTTQGNLKGTERIDTSSDLGQYAMNTYLGNDPDRLNPFHPSLFGNPQPHSGRLLFQA